MSGSRSSRMAAMIAAAINNVDFIRLWSCMASVQVSRSCTIARFISAITVTSGASASHRCLCETSPRKSHLAGISAFPCGAAFIMEGPICMR